LQANLWTEYIPTFQQAEYMILPRLAALCEVQWSQPQNKNYESFLLRMNSMRKFYDLYNYNYAKHIFDGSDK
jgi:hexosaminidase